MTSRYKIGRDTFHYKWSNSHKPVLTISPGDTVTFEINDVGSWQITPDTTATDLKSFDPEKLYPLAGPVYVKGAAPGDSLLVEVKDVQVDDFGWTEIVPDFGILEEFTQPYLYKWNLADKEYATFAQGIRIPLRPFCGVMGVAPSRPGRFEVAPPDVFGGNLDIRHLTAGSTLELPVQVDGALFSTGDVHAAMGDGEVCISAIECAGRATMSFDLRKGTKLRWPRYTTGPDDGEARGGYHAATGISPDLFVATKEAVRNMIDYLTSDWNLTRDEAYVLCSVAVDLRVHEVVDKPNWVVGAMIPRSIFPARTQSP